MRPPRFANKVYAAVEEEEKIPCTQKALKLIARLQRAPKLKKEWLLVPLLELIWNPMKAANGCESVNIGNLHKPLREGYGSHSRYHSRRRLLKGAPSEFSRSSQPHVAFAL